MLGARGLGAVGLLFLGGWVGSGCAYAADRGRDFADIWGLGAGLGLGVNLRATQYAQLGAGLSYGIGRTLGRRAWAPVGPTVEIGVAPLAWYRSVKESRVMILARTLLDADSKEKWHRWYDPTVWTFAPGGEEYQRNFDRRLFDIGFSAYLLIGFDFDFNPVEFADFFLGLFTVDFAGDDDDDDVRVAPGTT